MTRPSPSATAKQSSDPSGRRRLGRGLRSLLNTAVRVDTPNEPPVDRPSDALPASTHEQSAGVSNGDGLRMIPVEDIRPNEYQPRRSFDEEALKSLAASIREAGMMQPIVVRPCAESDGFELVAGERRWRAAQIVGLPRVPAVIREVDHQTAAQWALIENIQREDLNAVERAQAFARLAKEFSLTHQEIADRVGLNRTSVTNHLRLLELEPQILELIATGTLSMGHGRAILAITNSSRRVELSRLAARAGWSVRELERRAQAEAAGGSRPSAKVATALPAHIDDLQRRLSEHLGSRVQLRPGAKKGTGTISIDFYSLDEFEGILRRLGFDPS